ncbi:hypothetical protein ACWD5Z_17690 [Micromonospora chokoriensis]
MTQGSIHTNGQKPRWAAPAPCAGVSTELIGLGPTRYLEDRNPDDLEAAALLRAFTAGNASLRRSQETVNARSAEVVTRYQAARTHIDRVDRFRGRGSVVEAVDEKGRVVRRHVKDGPEDRRRRAIRPGLLWVVLGASALFDAAFIGSIMQMIFDVDWTDLLFYLAYLPGIGIAVCLYVAGAELATHLLRRRERLNRRRKLPPLTPAVVLRRLFWEWRPEPLERQEDDLPWPRLSGPVLFGTLVLGLLSVAALVRALSAARESSWLMDYVPAFVVLIVLLSIGAVAVKVQSHNPYTDSSERAERQLEGVEKRADELIREARDSVAEHGKAWDALQSAISTAKATAREVVEEACAVMLETRSSRTKRDEVKIALPLVWLAWPAEHGSVHRSDTQLPGLDLTLLDYATEAADRYRPETLARSLEAANDRLNGQFQSPRTTSADQVTGHGR